MNRIVASNNFFMSPHTLLSRAPEEVPDGGHEIPRKNCHEVSCFAWEEYAEEVSFFLEVLKAGSSTRKKEFRIRSKRGL
jgi:hypothetical protein